MTASDSDYDGSQSTMTAWRATARRHWQLVALLVAGVVVRAMTMLAYPPALFFGDSWGYVTSAFSGGTFGAGSPAISNFRPSGYPVLIWLLSVPGRDLGQLVAVQHLAGLGIGVLIYMTLVRTGVSRWAAAAAAALVLLDGYAIALEQYVMADTFFALVVLLAVLVVAWPALSPSSRVGPARAAVAGLLLAVSTLVRLEGLFALPVLAGYLVWRRVGWRPLLAFGLATLLPLLGYAALEQHNFGTFGLSQWSGWTEYGRIAGFADCAGAGIPHAQRPLCETAAQRKGHPDASVWYLFDGDSPAIRMFGGLDRTIAVQRHSDAVLASFAQRIALHQPLDTVAAVTVDFLRFFAPARPSSATRRGPP